MHTHTYTHTRAVTQYSHTWKKHTRTIMVNKPSVNIPTIPSQSCYTEQHGIVLLESIASADFTNAVRISCAYSSLWIDWCSFEKKNAIKVAIWFTTLMIVCLYNYWLWALVAIDDEANDIHELWIISCSISAFFAVNWELRIDEKKMFVSIEHSTLYTKEGASYNNYMSNYLTVCTLYMCTCIL